MDTTSAVLLAEAQQALNAAKTQDALVRAMITAVRRLLGFGGFEFGLVRTDAGAPTELEAWLSIDVTPGGVPAWRPTTPLFAPALDPWMRACTPLVVCYPEATVSLPRDHVVQCIRRGITNAVFQAALYWPARRAFYCVVTHLRTETLRTAPALLELMAPACEGAWRRVLIAQGARCGHLTDDLADLSDVQRRVLQWIGHGRTNREIGQIEGLSEHGVKYHVKQIFAKINVTNRAQAAVRLAELGQLPGGGGVNAGTPQR